MSAGLTRHFPTTELAQIGDETKADGPFHPGEFIRYRTSTRVVLTSLARLRACFPGNAKLNIFSPFVLFKYQLHPLSVDEFGALGMQPNS